MSPYLWTAAFWADARNMAVSELPQPCLGLGATPWLILALLNWGQFASRKSIRPGTGWSRRETHPDVQYRILTLPVEPHRHSQVPDDAFEGACMCTPTSEVGK